MAQTVNSPVLKGERGVLASWDRFFFTPADPRPLGLVRIAVGLLLLWSLGWLAADLRGFLGSEGWIDQAFLREIHRNHWEWSFWNVVPDRFHWMAWAVSMSLIAMFTVGLFSRVTAPLAWAIAVSTTRRNPSILFGFDQIITYLMFFLAVSGASGQALSVDRFLGTKRRGPTAVPSTISANLGLRLVQINMAIIYGASGLSKLRGMSWWDGSAIIKNLGNAEFRPADFTWILATSGGVYFLNLATHLALWTEILYPVLIWKRGFRRLMLGAVVVLHAGIALTLGLTEFSLAMLAGNLAFVRWPASELPAKGGE